MSDSIDKLVSAYDDAQRCFHNYQDWTDEQRQPIYDATAKAKEEVAKLNDEKIGALKFASEQSIRAGIAEVENDQLKDKST
jgi:hypothetical protein